MLKSTVVLIAVIALAYSAAFCQSPDATVAGRVVDTSTAVIAGAKVEVISLATGVHRTGETNREGSFVIPNLAPGPYRIEVAKNGFKTVIREDVVLHVQDVVALNFTLPIGSTTESVTVEGGAPLVNTQDAAVSTVIDRTFVENIPLNGRSFQSLILLTPGVTQVSGASVGFQGEFSINGQRTETNYYSVDGVSANTGTGGVGIAVGGGVTPAESALGTTQSMVSVDALQEFRINTSSYSAEYGRTPGGQISFQTRSGTNFWHGSLFDYFRNDALDSNNWFNDAAGLPKTAERQNDFGGTLGGPVRIPGLYNGKDRTFFFFSYEGLRLQVPQPAVTLDVPDMYLRQNSPAAMRPLLNAFPIPNGPDNPDHSAEYTASYSTPSSLDAYSIRLDHSFNPKLILFGRFAYTPSDSVSRSVANFNGNLAVKSKFQSNVKSVTLGATSTFSSTLANDLRFNYTQNNSLDASTLDNFGGATPFRIADAFPGVHLSEASQFDAIFGIGTFPGIDLFVFDTPQTQWNVNDNLTWAHGKHTLKFGGDYRRLWSLNGENALWDTLFYLSTSDIQTNSASVVQVLSNGSPKTGIFTNYSAYVQDEWAYSPRLHLSLGLRWDLNPVPKIGNGPQPYTLNQVNDLSTAHLAPQGTPLWRTDPHAFAPRVGITYQLNQSNSRESVIRAAVGMFYDIGNWQALDNAYLGIGFGSSASYFGAPYPLTPAQNTLPAPSIASPYNGTVYAPDPHLRMPYTLQWNVSFQQALGTNQALTLSYVGAGGRELLSSHFYNPATNPNFVLGNGVFITDNGSNSNYNALQAQFQRRLTHGLQVLASYTWSHSIDNLSNTENSYQPSLRGNSDFDLRHNFSAGFTYDIPATSANDALRAVIGHWGIDLRQTARTAMPVDIQTGYGTLPNGQNIYLRPDLVPGVPVYVSDPSAPGGRVINYNAFQPSPALVGDSPRNFVRGFDAWQTDLAIRREFPIHEQLKLQFRAESFNLLNHPNFGSIYNVLSDGPQLFGRAENTLNNSLGGLNALYQMGGPRSLQLALKFIF